MTRTSTELSYLRASIESASSVDLVIILYDMLIRDLQGAIDAISCNDIEGRSKQLKHGFLVLEQMEASLDMNNGAAAATALARFYAALRANIMDGHVKASAEILNRQRQLVLEVRSAWAKVSRQNAAASTASQASKVSASDSYDSSEVLVPAGSWSA